MLMFTPFQWKSSSGFDHELDKPFLSEFLQMLGAAKSRFKHF